MKRETFIKRRLLDFLTRLEASPGNYLTAYLSSSSFPRYAADRVPGLDSLPEDIREALGTEVVLREVQRYGTGAVIFWSENHERFIIVPPFDLPEDKVFRGRPQTSLLHQLLEKERILGIVLVTWGSYAIGVFKGDRLVKSKTGTGYIHKQHRKGGRSEKRFARRTEEQKNSFLRRVANRIGEIFRDYRLEHIFFGGNRLILKPLVKECSYLESEAQQISNRFVNVRHADGGSLLESLEEVNKSLVFSYEG